MKAILLALVVACTVPAQPYQQLSAIQQLDITDTTDGMTGHCTVWHLSGKHWMTAAHCTNTDYTYEANDQPFVVERADMEADLALLTGPDGAPDLSLGTTPLFGAPVHFIGYPWYGGEVHPGVYDGNWGTCPKDGVAKSLCEWSGFTDGGASGAPLFDANGKVVGVVDASFLGTPYSYVVPVDTIRKFLAAKAK